MSHSYTSLYYHIVYSTHRREPLIADELGERLIKYTGGILRAQDCSLLAGRAMPEHVHLLVRGHPSKSVAELLRVIKSRTSWWATHEAGADVFGWQSGYGAFTVSKSGVDDVERYIATQDEHHKRMTFKEEFIALLERHGVEYDPRYVWVD
jgi:REP element-mobilizing transposase RayT